MFLKLFYDLLYEKDFKKREYLLNLFIIKYVMMKKKCEMNQ